MLFLLIQFFPPSTFISKKKKTEKNPGKGVRKGRNTNILGGFLLQKLGSIRKKEYKKDQYVLYLNFMLFKKFMKINQSYFNIINFLYSKSFQCWAKQICSLIGLRWKLERAILDFGLQMQFYATSLTQTIIMSPSQTQLLL